MGVGVKRPRAEPGRAFLPLRQSRATTALGAAVASDWSGPGVGGEGTVIHSSHYIQDGP